MEKINKFDTSVIPYLLTVKPSRYWVDYDEMTDTLYLSFRKPQCANDSIMEDNFIYHYANDDLVGVTVLNAQESSGK